MYELKMNNLLVDVGILSFVLNKLHFKQSFSNICRNRCFFFSQINLNQTFFWGCGVCPGGFWHGEILSGGFMSGGLSPRDCMSGGFMS